MSAMAATGAALRLRLLFRMLRVGELIALAAFLSWSTSRAPSAAAAALRVAGSLLFSPRFVFVLGNAIVLLLLALSRRERVDPSPASSSAGDGALTSDAPAAASFGSFATPTTPTPMPMPASEAPAVVLPTMAMAMATVPEEEEVVKPVVSLTTRAAAVSKARAPRRTRSEKMGRRSEPSRRAASPEPLPLMRRSESDNGRRRRSSVTARDVAEVGVGVARGWAGTDDAEEFRRTVEAFIAKQTRFRREEESMAGTLVVVE